jgi:hypothetical protein
MPVYPTLGHQEVTLEVEDSWLRPTDSWELAEFLYLFRAAYSRALELDRIDEDRLIEDPYPYRQQFEQAFPPGGTNVERVGQLFSADWGDDDLRFARISRTSPLAFTCVGVVVALALAAIISGGRVDITATGIRFKLAPLGTGIKHLLDAFRLPPPNRRPRLKR